MQETHAVKSAVSSRVKNALDWGWLINLEDHKGLPQNLKRGNPIPDDQTSLPSVE